MKLRFAVIAVSSAILTACATSSAVSIFKDFQVNGETVTASYQQGIYDDQLAAGRTDSPELQEAVRKLAVERYAVRQEAEKTGVASDPAVLRRIEDARIRILAQAVSADYLKKNPVAQTDVIVAYDKAKREYGTTEYHVRQIFVNNEADAKALSARLAKKPSAFAEYARTDNDNEELKRRGGDMGWISPSALRDPAFKDVLLKTKPGSNAQAVKSNAGWHFLRVEAIRPAQNFPSYDKARAGIANRLAQEKAREHILSLVKNAKVQ